MKNRVLGVKKISPLRHVQVSQQTQKSAAGKEVKKTDSRLFKELLVQYSAYKTLKAVCEAEANSKRKILWYVAAREKLDSYQKLEKICRTSELLRGQKKVAPGEALEYIKTVSLFSPRAGKQSLCRAVLLSAAVASQNPSQQPAGA